MKIVILAGGAGTRFWPRSVRARPKQFLSLTSEETMLQQTYRRCRRLLPEMEVYVVTARSYRSLVESQLPELPRERLLLEPEQRDTGPCIALVASRFLAQADDEVIVTMPSDHFTDEPEQLFDALIRAEREAVIGRTIVTLGVAPTRPETGFGYIRTEEAGPGTADGVLQVRQFVEKPTLETAQRLIREPGVYWNSGIFVWKPSTISYYMRRHQPALWKALEDGMPTDEAYAALPGISVDYAVLEKADTILTIPVHFRWDDVGLWTSLARIRQTDDDGNLIDGAGHTHAESTRDSIIYSDHPQTLVIGVRDLIIVSTAEGLLVCHKSEEQRIKRALQTLERPEGGA